MQENQKNIKMTNGKQKKKMHVECNSKTPIQDRDDHQELSMSPGKVLNQPAPRWADSNSNRSMKVKGQHKILCTGWLKLVLVSCCLLPCAGQEMSPKVVVEASGRNHTWDTGPVCGPPINADGDRILPPWIDPNFLWPIPVLSELHPVGWGALAEWRTWSLGSVWQTCCLAVLWVYPHQYLADEPLMHGLWLMGLGLFGCCWDAVRNLRIHCARLHWARFKKKLRRQRMKHRKLKHQQKYKCKMLAGFLACAARRCKKRRYRQVRGKVLMGRSLTRSGPFKSTWLFQTNRKPRNVAWVQQVAQELKGGKGKRKQENPETLAETLTGVLSSWKDQQTVKKQRPSHQQAEDQRLAKRLLTMLKTCLNQGYSDDQVVECVQKELNSAVPNQTPKTQNAPRGSMENPP